MKFVATTGMKKTITREDCYVYAKKVGDLIFEYKKDRKIPAKDYQERFGINRSMLSMMRNKKALPSLETLLKISAETGIGIDTLLDWSPRK